MNNHLKQLARTALKVVSVESKVLLATGALNDDYRTNTPFIFGYDANRFNVCAVDLQLLVTVSFYGSSADYIKEIFYNRIDSVVGVKRFDTMYGYFDGTYLNFNIDEHELRGFAKRRFYESLNQVVSVIAFS